MELPAPHKIGRLLTILVRALLQRELLVLTVLSLLVLTIRKATTPLQADAQFQQHQLVLVDPTLTRLLGAPTASQLDFKV